MSIKQVSLRLEVQWCKHLNIQFRTDLCSFMTFIALSMRTKDCGGPEFNGEGPWLGTFVYGSNGGTDVAPTEPVPDAQPRKLSHNSPLRKMGPCNCQQVSGNATSRMRLLNECLNMSHI